MADLSLTIGIDPAPAVSGGQQVVRSLDAIKLAAQAAYDKAMALGGAFASLKAPSFTSAATGADKLSSAMKSVSQSAAEMTRQINTLTTALGGFINSATTATNQMKALATGAQVTGAALGAMGAQVKALPAAHGAAATAANSHSVSLAGVKLNSFQLTEASRIMMDLFTGQYSRAIRSGTVEMNSLGVTQKLIAAAFTPLGAAVLAFTVVLGASVAKAIEFENQQRSMALTLGLTRNAAGLSLAQLNALADATARATDQTSNGVRAQEEILLKYWKVGGQVFSDLTMSVRDFATATGQSREKATDELGKLFSDPAKGAEKLHEMWGVLDYDQQRNIEFLQKSGDMVGAQKALWDAYQQSVHGAYEKGTSPLTKSVDELSASVGRLFEQLGNGTAIQGLLHGLSNVLGVVNELIAKASLLGSSFGMFAYVMSGFNADAAKLGTSLGNSIQGAVVGAFKISTGQVNPWRPTAENAAAQTGSPGLLGFNSNSASGSAPTHDDGMAAFDAETAAAVASNRVNQEALDLAHKNADARDLLAVRTRKLEEEENTYWHALAIGDAQSQKTIDGLSIVTYLRAHAGDELNKQTILEAAAAAGMGQSVEVQKRLKAEAVEGIRISQQAMTQDQANIEITAAGNRAVEQYRQTLDRKSATEESAFSRAQASLDDQLAAITALDKAGSGTYATLTDGATKWTAAQAAQLEPEKALIQAFQAGDAAAKALQTTLRSDTGKALGPDASALVTTAQNVATLSSAVAVETARIDAGTRTVDQHDQAMAKLTEQQDALAQSATAYGIVQRQMIDNDDKAIDQLQTKANDLAIANQITALEIVGTQKSAEVITQLRTAQALSNLETQRKIQLAPVDARIDAARSTALEAENVLLTSNSQAERTRAAGTIRAAEDVITEMTRAKDGINQATDDIELQTKLKFQLDAARQDANTFGSGVQNAFKEMGRGIQQSISSLFENLFSGGIKTAKDFVSQIGQVLRTGLSQFVGGIASAGINSLLGPVFNSVSASVGGLFGSSSSSDAIAQALASGTKNANGSVTTTTGTTFSASDIASIAGKANGLGGGGGLFGGINSFASNNLPSSIYTTPTADVIGPQLPGTGAGGLLGSGVSASQAVAGIGALISLGTFAAHPTIGSGIGAVGGGLGAAAAFGLAGAWAGPVGLGLAIAGPLLDGLFGGKPAARDSAVRGGSVVGGRIDPNAYSAVDKNGDPGLVSAAVTTVANSINSLAGATGLSVAKISDYILKFGSAVKDYNAFYGPDFLTQDPGSIQYKTAQSVGYQHQVKADDQAAMSKQAADVAFIVAKDPGSWDGLTSAMTRALTNSSATDVAGLQSDLTFVASLTQSLNDLKAAGGGVEGQLKALQDTANKTGLDLATQVTSTLARVGQLLGSTSDEYAQTIEAGKTAVLNSMGLGSDQTQLGGLTLSLAQARLGMQAMQPALAALGYTAQQQADLINQALAKSQDALRAADNASLDVADRQARGLGVVDQLTGLQSARDAQLASGSDPGRVTKLFTDSVNALFSSISADQLPAVVNELSGELRDMGNAAIRASLAEQTVVSSTNQYVQSLITIGAQYDKAVATLTTKGGDPRSALGDFRDQLATTLGAMDDASLAQVAKYYAQYVGQAQDAAGAVTNIQDAVARQQVLNAQTVQTAVTTSATAAAQAIQQALIDAANKAADALEKSAADIKAYLEGTVTSAVSPFSLQDQLSFAQQQYAANQNPTTAQSVLDIGSQFYGKTTGDYADLYRGITGNLAGVGAQQSADAATNRLFPTGLGFDDSTVFNSPGELAAAQGAARAYQQAVDNAKSNYLGSLSGFLTLGGARATGGPVEAGRLYEVNEGATGRRFEGFVPATAGTVVPLSAGGGANDNGVAEGIEALRAEIRALRKQQNAETQAQIQAAGTVAATVAKTARGGNDRRRRQVAP